jgi:hypothetical protein
MPRQSFGEQKTLVPRQNNEPTGEMHKSMLRKTKTDPRNALNWVNWFYTANYRSAPAPAER